MGYVEYRLSSMLVVIGLKSYADTYRLEKSNVFHFQRWSKWVHARDVIHRNWVRLCNNGYFKTGPRKRVLNNCTPTPFVLYVLRRSTRMPWLYGQWQNVAAECTNERETESTQLCVNQFDLLLAYLHLPVWCMAYAVRVELSLTLCKPLSRNQPHGNESILKVIMTDWCPTQTGLAFTRKHSLPPCPSVRSFYICPSRACQHP